MSLLIDNPDLEQIVKAIAAVTGEPQERTVEVALKERLERVTRSKGDEMLKRIRPFLDRVAAMPELDPRPASVILGYNGQGTFD